MTFRTPGAGRAIRMPQRPRLLVPVLAAVAVILLLFGIFTGLWTDLLWFRSLGDGYQRVFLTQLSTQVALFVIAGLLMAVLVGVNMVIAHRVRPAYRPLSLEQQALDRYRAVLDPHRRLAIIAIAGLLGLLTGSSAAGQWRTWLLFANRMPFGVKDFQFRMDISFFTFVYPFLRLLLGFAFAGVIMSILAAVAVHYLYGGLRLQTPGPKASTGARVHLSVLFGVFVLLKAVAYWLDRYGLAYSERGFVTGPSYTDVNAVLPAKTILTIIALICAGLFFAGVVRRGAMLPGVSLGLLVLSAVLVGGVYPALIQQFQVKPSEPDKEARYIDRNIRATRAAYGVDGTQVIPYSAETKLSSGQLASEATTISGVRLLDPKVVSPTFQQLQQVRNFYRFPDSLDIDRYPIENATRDTVVAVREIEGAPEGRKNWINDHLVYTHGFGFVAAPGNRVTEKGEPAFIVRDIPPNDALGEFEPRVYFGERSPQYSIVGAPRGTPPGELDFPDESPAGQQNTTYSGRGGVPMGSFFNRLLYTVKYREKNILLSGRINNESRILYIRSPRDRIQRVAPFLTVDGDPYPAIVDGRIVWILDGYTTSAGYPYSQRESLAEATRDTITAQTRAVVQQPRDRINYIRNSVKATVDAYDGTVRLYQWDDKDPVLRTWMKVFPGVIKAKSAISPALTQHLRYPEDLFKVQRKILERYHVTQAQAFYGGQDFWEIPQDPAAGGNKQPPYFLSLKMPDEKTPKFSLTTVFNPRQRPNLAAFMAVDATPGEDYGQIRILELPRNSPIQGPGQVQNSFEADPKIKEELFKLRQGGTETVDGNLLTLPFGGGLLYVGPVYARATAAEAEPYPILKLVRVSFGNVAGSGATLQEALNQVFTGGGASTPQQPGKPTEVSPQLRAALEEAQEAYQAGVEALKRGDWQAYGEAQERLRGALEEAARLQST